MKKTKAGGSTQNCQNRKLKNQSMIVSKIIISFYLKQLENLKKKKKSLKTVPDKDRNKQGNINKVLKICKEHFEKHLNFGFSHEAEALDGKIVAMLDDVIEPNITKDEITKVNKALKNRESPRFDNITTEAIKAGRESMINILKKKRHLSMGQK